MTRLRGWRRGLAAGAVALSGLVAAQSARAFSVDFDTVPGGTPSNGLAINTQYEASEDVIFSLQGGGSPVLVQEGNTTSGLDAFQLGPNGSDPNTLEPGQNVDWFLNATGQLGVPPALVLNFTTPMNTVQGDVLDIDHSDGWTIQALAIGPGNMVVDQVVLDTSSPDTGSGIATPFTLTSTSNNINEVVLDMTSHGPDPGYGWANFSFTNVMNGVVPPVPAVPLPSAAWQGAALLAALCFFPIRRRVRVFR